MKAQLILAQAGDRLALFVNAKLVLSYTDDDIEDAEQRILTSAQQLATALNSPLCTVKLAPFAGDEQTWQERYEEVLAGALGVPKLTDHDDLVIYMWDEGGVHPVTQDGSGDAYDDMAFDLSPPQAGTPFIVLVPLAESRMHAEAAVRASVLEDFKHWLNDRRGLDVSLVFHETVAKVETLINLSAAVPAGKPVNVRYWDAYTAGDMEPSVDTHKFEIDDLRDASGQARLVLSSLEEGNADNHLDVLMEVNTNPLNGLEHVECAHVHVDGDDPLMSLFRIGDKLLAVPDTSVRFVSDSLLLNGQRQSVLWIE
ncbi:hypothetical protein AB4Y45_34990 [Paraburkholderia sp. EG287A]|uniref:hypothetical protein n=1 Tax=Paraburkholderia sp. EG287A TaxID=3237012 RepID=UPI0034D1A095